MDPEKNKKYIIFNAIIISILKDNGLLFIKRIKPVPNIERIIKAIKNWLKWLIKIKFIN